MNEIVEQYNQLLSKKWMKNNSSKSANNLQEDFIEKYTLTPNPYKIELNTNDITDKFNISFLMGDLNYRIDNENFYISECLKMNNLGDILIHDQLTKEIQIGKLNLKKFKEGEIKFNPTYKYNPGTSNYLLGSNEKMPGWTDRILFKIQILEDIHKNLELKLINYFSINDVFLSDHKPVGAVFEINL
jgi:hypothetical protein